MPKLLPVYLQGSDSSEIESLPSYLVRSARIHRVSVGDIIRFSIDTYPDVREVGFSRYSYLKPQDILQPNKTSISLVKLLSHCSGQALEQASFLWLDDALGRTSNELIKGFRWCPECFHEMEATGIEPYFKLKWHLSAFNHCPLHFTDFISACESCGNDQTTYIRKHNIAKCQKCGESLAQRKANLSAGDIHLSIEENAFDIQQLFSDLAKTRFKAFPKGGVLKSLDEVFDWYWENDLEEESYELLGRDKALSLLHKQKDISLIVARRLAFKLGISLYTLMSGNAKQASMHLNFKLFCPVPVEYLSAKKKKHRDHEFLLKLIMKKLDGFEEPPSIKSVAIAVGISVGYIRYRYPVLLKKIVKNHQEYLAKQRLNKIYTAQKMALSYFIDQKYSEYPKSKHQAYKEVKRETGLAKGVIEQAVKRAYRALYN